MRFITLPIWDYEFKTFVDVAVREDHVLSITQIPEGEQAKHNNARTEITVQQGLENNEWLCSYTLDEVLDAFY